MMLVRTSYYLTTNNFNTCSQYVTVLFRIPYITSEVEDAILLRMPFSPLRSAVRPTYFINIPAVNAENHRAACIMPFESFCSLLKEVEYSANFKYLCIFHILFIYINSHVYCDLWHSWKVLYTLFVGSILRKEYVY